MCCYVTILVFFGPRTALALWWLIDQTRFNLAFNTAILPILGFLFLPWTTLMWVVVWNPVSGLDGFGWLWIVLAFLVDIGTLSGGAYGNRNRMPGYARS